MDRFMDTFNQTKSGSIPPAIDVREGCRGVKLCDVYLDSKGE
jgi:hypothetical protein